MGGDDVRYGYYDYPMLECNAGRLSRIDEERYISVEEEILLMKKEGYVRRMDPANSKRGFSSSSCVQNPAIADFWHV